MSQPRQVLVLTIDQQSSSTDLDRVPDVLAALNQDSSRDGLLRAFQRTAGDEIQGVLDNADALAPILDVLLRHGGWYVGIGAGTVEEPLPPDARAGRGPAYLSAREAVTTAKSSPWPIRVVGRPPHDRALESALWLWAALLARRTTRGWEVADLVDTGLTYEEVGRRLGISQSAVSQRAQAAGIAEGRRARELVTHLADDLLRTTSRGAS